jgi:hypothetical protein
MAMPPDLPPRASPPEHEIHQRVNVRILELIDRDTGASVQLEGNRIPTLHTGEVLKVLRED